MGPTKMDDDKSSRSSEIALKKIASLFAVPLFAVGGVVLSGDPKEAKRHFTSKDPSDPVGLEAFVNHYHLEDYVEEFSLEPRRKRRELNRLADALILVWAERLAGILAERTALFYAGGEEDVIVRFHLERPDEPPWMSLDPDFVRKARMRVFRASRSGLERIA